jgi:hypothetical protein
MITLIGPDRSPWPYPVIGMVGRARATRRAALYVRVGTSDRGQSNQLAPL